MIEAGRDDVFIEVGDLVSVPSTLPVAAAETRNARATGVCLNVKAGTSGSAYGYVDMGGWMGGQAEYVMIPYADFNVLKFRQGTGDGED